MTDQSKYVLREQEGLSPRYLTYEQATVEIQERTRPEEPEEWWSGRLLEGSVVEIDGRTWTPLTTAVERWVVWNPNTSDARVFQTLADADRDAADREAGGYAVSPVYA